MQHSTTVSVQMTAPGVSVPLISRLKEAAIVTLVLVGALAFFYRDVVFGGHTFMVEGSMMGTMPLSADRTQGPYGYTGPLNNYERDQWTKAIQAEPANHFAAVSFQSGQFPFWNPYEGLGTPFYSSGQVGVFDPIRLLLATLLPLKWWIYSVDLQLLLRYFLAGLFTYLFLRSLGATLVPSLAAAITFMFSTYFLLYGNMPHVAVELLFPLTMLAYHRLATNQSLTAFVLCSLSIFLLVVTEFPELYPLQLGFALLWYSFQTILLMRNEPEKLHFAFRMALRFVAATILGFMLGAFVLLPFVQDFLDASNIHGPTQIFRLPINGLAGFFVITPSEYARLSVGALVLTVIGLILGFTARLDDRQKKLFIQSAVLLGIGLIALPVSYNVPIFRLLLRLPVLNMIFLGKYILPIIAFFVACAAGIGLDLLLSLDIKQRFQRVLFCGISALMLIGLVMGVLLIGPGVDYVNVRAGASLVFDSAVLLVFLFGFSLKKIAKKIANPGLPGMFFVALLVLEPAVVNSFWETRSQRYDPFTVPPFINYLQQQSQPFRIIATREDIVIPNQASAYALDDVRYQDALDPIRYVLYCKYFLVKPLDPKDDITCVNQFNHAQIYDRHLDLLNVEYILSTSPVAPTRDDSSAPFELAFQSDGVYVYRNPNVLPRAFVVPQAEVLPNLQAVLDRVGSKDFDPRRTVLLEEAPPQGFTNLTPSAGQPEVAPARQNAQVVSRSDNDMTVQATLTAPGFLVVSELYYPGWQAVVDGKPGHLYSADGPLRAVALAAGEHSVEFHFRPTIFYVGLLVALVALVILLAAFIVQRFRSHVRR